jgi:predicted nucleic-acid-binding Zn-ribbon protein
MKQTGTCPKCHSTDILTNVHAIDRGGKGAEYDLRVATYTNPDAWVFKGQQDSTLSAWVCAACGFLEFYADNPQALKIQPE